MNPVTGRARWPAFLCMVVFLLCEAISLPYAEMGVGDDWSYIRTAQLLAQTGHIHYNGWAAPMLGWQLFPAAALFKLFGFSFTIARLPCLLAGALTAFLIQRIFVHVGVSERNSIIGTLAIVLTPLYMELSATFMTDIPGLFAVVVCLYGCLRALQIDNATRASLWICFAALSNAVFGTSRQIAWLGVLVMVPCALWLLRRRPKTLVVGGTATLASWAFVALCLHWLKQQPYAVPESIFFIMKGSHQWAVMFKGLGGAILETQFLILPIIAAYLVVFPGNARSYWKPLAICGLGYAVIIVAAFMTYGLVPHAILEPRLGDWVTVGGGYTLWWLGPGPIVLNKPVQVVLTAVSLLSTLCAVLFLWSIRDKFLGQVWSARESEFGDSEPAASWSQLLVLIGPFTAAYFALLIPRASVHMMDRYLLPLTFVFGLLLVRAFQDFVRRSLPPITTAFVGVIAIYSIGCMHDMFAAYRAIAVATAEIPAAGLPSNALEGGFEHDYWVEIVQHGHINDEKITNPPDSFIPVCTYRGWSCEGDGKTTTPPAQVPHFSPRYGLSWKPNRCAGPTSFAPSHYFRWLGLKTTPLFIVNYQPNKLVGSISSDQPMSPR